MQPWLGAQGQRPVHFRHPLRARLVAPLRPS
jgi:hypothetical protein